MIRELFSELKKRYFDIPITLKINLNNIVVIIIFIVLLTLFSNKTSSDIIIENTISGSIQNLELVNQNLHSLFENVERMSNTVVANSTVQEYLVTSDTVERHQNEYKVKGIFDNIIEPRTAASTILVYSLNGMIVTSGKVEYVPVTSDESIFPRLAAELEDSKNDIIYEDLHTIHYELGKSSTECISFKRNIVNSDTAGVIGYQIINVNEDIISKIYSSVKYGETGKFIIVNSEGVIVSSADKSELYRNISKQGYFKWISENDKGGKIFNINGRKYLVSCSKFTPMGWSIAGIVPLDELLQNKDRVTLMIYLAGVACIILAVVLSLFLSRSITKPVKKLSKLMNTAGEGQLDVRLEFYGNDEVGVLARSFNRMLGKISSLMEEVYNEQKKKREYELLALQAQINPHFLYNTLESICSLIKLNWNENALELVQTLGKFYRMVLSKGENVVSIRHETEIITQYLAIQKVRYREQLEYSIDIDEEILDKKIIKLSIQPIVENSIYHGIKNKGEPGTLSITGRKDDNHVIISVVDNGIGISEDILKDLIGKDSESRQKISFGLRSVDERIKLQFGNEYGIKIVSEQGKGTSVDIILPVD